MAISLKSKEEFITLRANNVSFEKIAKQLKVSKSTLIAWAKEHELDINNLRAISYEELHEQYKIGKQHRLVMWAEQLEAIRAELKKRGFGDVPTIKLIELMGSLDEKIKSEAYKVEFKSEAIEKTYEIEPLTTIDQDTWRG